MTVLTVSRNTYSTLNKTQDIVLAVNYIKHHWQYTKQYNTFSTQQKTSATIHYIVQYLQSTIENFIWYTQCNTIPKVHYTVKHKQYITQYLNPLSAAHYDSGG